MKAQKICFILVFISPLFLSQTPVVNTKVIASNLMAPVAMAVPNDGSKRIFVCEQTGKIKIIRNGKVNERPYLDLGKKLAELGKGYSEKGLLGLVFHPQYKSNGRFFVYYTAPPSGGNHDHRNIVAGYKVSSDPDVAEASSETVILDIQQPEGNHCGGQLAFGPDGKLYIGLGDGGGAGDRHGEKGNGQNLETVLGKILRIDVDKESPYSVPADNPFVNTNNAKPEIWAWGIRNAWRFSFDRKTGKMFCADVGQNRWEEVDVIEKGKNYGWRIMEGNHCYNPAENCDTKNLTPPVAEYDHSKGICIIGGYVYRGSKSPTLNGRYVFGDWKGKLFYLEETAGKYELKDLNLKDQKNNDIKLNINSFGEDEDGEIYILAQKTMGTFLSNGQLLHITTQ